MKKWYFILILFSLVNLSCTTKEYGFKEEGVLKSVIYFEDSVQMKKLIQIIPKGVNSTILFYKNTPFSFRGTSFQYPRYYSNKSPGFYRMNLALDASNSFVTYYFITDKTDSLVISYKREFETNGSILYYRNLKIVSHSFKNATLEIFNTDQLNNDYSSTISISSGIYDNLAGTFLKLEN